WVAPTARRQGIGARLIDSVTAWAEASGATALVLDVVAANTSAIALYERAGFRRSDGEAMGGRAPNEIRFVRTLWDACDDPVRIRKATLADVPAIKPLIATSARMLGAGDYTAEQIEAALLGVWGVDTEIIRDETYFVGEVDSALVLCGGWSRRATL